MEIALYQTSRLLYQTRKLASPGGVRQLEGAGGDESFDHQENVLEYLRSWNEDRNYRESFASVTSSDTGREGGRRIHRRRDSGKTKETV